MTKAQEKFNLHEDHRKRMDEKSETSGLHTMPEHEVLEKILFAVIPRGNTNEIAQKLCRRFDGIGNVLMADVKDLMEVEGVGKRTAYFLHELPDVLGIVERSLSFGDRRIKSRADAQKYVQSFFYGKLHEQFYIISLTSSGKIIKHTKLSDGTTDEVHIYARNVVQTALRDKAHSVIIAHNHLGETAQASFADVKCTEEIAKSLSLIGINLYESVIVARGESVSVFDNELCNIKR